MIKSSEIPKPDDAHRRISVLLGVDSYESSPEPATWMDEFHSHVISYNELGGGAVVELKASGTGEAVAVMASSEADTGEGRGLEGHGEAAGSDEKAGGDGDAVLDAPVLGRTSPMPPVLKMGGVEDMAMPPPPTPETLPGSAPILDEYHQQNNPPVALDTPAHFTTESLPGPTHFPDEYYQQSNPPPALDPPAHFLAQDGLLYPHTQIGASLPALRDPAYPAWTLPTDNFLFNVEDCLGHSNYRICLFVLRQFLNNNMSADDMCTQMTELLAGHAALLKEFETHVGSRYSKVALRAKEILAVRPQEPEVHQTLIAPAEPIAEPLPVVAPKTVPAKRKPGRPPAKRRTKTARK
ncbi:hypothetical protein EDC01DRAFT_211380 [Geopyxis carbonaria]|nr:hypothetical protein EDC01DRAFT_211380 [Geopyxis carbonaria]